MGFSVCLVAAGVTIALGSPVTLAWKHSVEKTEWRETWTAGADGLTLREARVQGSGAGMEPPPDARLEGDFFVWNPHLAPQASVSLRRSGATADWRICTEDTCRTMTDILHADTDPVTLTACQAKPD